MHTAKKYRWGARTELLTCGIGKWTPIKKKEQQKVQQMQYFGCYHVLYQLALLCLDFKLLLVAVAVSITVLDCKLDYKTVSHSWCPFVWYAGQSYQSSLKPLITVWQAKGFFKDVYEILQTKGSVVVLKSCEDLLLSLSWPHFVEMPDIPNPQGSPAVCGKSLSPMSCVEWWTIHPHVTSFC